MLLVFSLGLGGALTLRPFEQSITLLIFGKYGRSLLREPYQDLLVLVPFVVAAVALIWLVSAWSLRPLARASREASMAGPRNPTARIGTRGITSEVRPLVDAVNGALDRLGTAFAAERRFTADAAHELRTPLTVLNLRIQRASLEGVADWATINRELLHMNRLVEQLLDLARKEHVGYATALSELPVINLSRVAREAAATVIPLAEAAGRGLDVELPDSLLARGRADDLRDVIRNLLDNALIHGQGTIRLHGSVTAERGKQGAILEVADDGPGIPATIQDLVFDRFYKGGRNTHGSGLGLAIVREVVRNHGGSIQLLPGLRCRAQIIFPAVLNVISPPLVRQPVCESRQVFPYGSAFVARGGTPCLDKEAPVIAERKCDHACPSNDRMADIAGAAGRTPQAVQGELEEQRTCCSTRARCSSAGWRAAWPASSVAIPGGRATPARSAARLFPQPR